MKKTFLATLVACYLCNAGCAPNIVNKTWEASGGSRAEATIELAFVYDPQNEKPSLSESQAKAEALKRCQSWGYTDAESFGMVKQICQEKRVLYGGGVICTSMLVTRQFQCLGQGNSTHKELSSEYMDTIETANKAFFKAGRAK